MSFARACLAGVVAIVAISPSASQSAGTPPHRRHHALTYDASSKRVLVHGGQHLVSNSEAPVLSDLWSWDGARWTQLSSSTGAGMIGHKLFADGDGGVFLTANASGLTARWDGQRWNAVVVDAATRREMAAGVYDPSRKRFVLFGGHVGGRSFPNDTWEFDGQRWTQVATSGPTPRLGGGMAFDARRQVVVLFGGIDSAGHKLGDTWELKGGRWTKVSSSGPSPRFGAGIAYDTRRGETILFGGADSANHKLSDTWRWNGETWRRADGGATPPSRSEGYLAYDDARGVIVMFGGEAEQTIPTLGDTWEWNGSQWKQALGIRQPPSESRNGRDSSAP